MPKPTIHLALMGMARSGTTMLSDLLTDPPARRVCLTEPRLHSSKPYRESKRAYFESVGFPGVEGPSGIINQIETRERFGVKEIRSRNMKRLYKMFDVEKTVVIVRDARACLLSYHTKHAKSHAKHKPFPGKLFIRSNKVVLRLLDGLPESSLRLVRYEELVADEAVRTGLSEWLGWPLNGDVTANMRLRGRNTETDQHGGAVSTASLGRAETPPTDEQRVELEPVLRKLQRFQSRFGYPLHFANELQERKS